MNELWTSLCHHAQLKPNQSALMEYRDSLETVYTWLQLQQEVSALARRLQEDGIVTLALHADNSAAWITVDLACNLAGVTLLPLPGFFSSQQLQHALDTVPVDAILTDNPERLADFTRNTFAISETILGFTCLTTNANPASTDVHARNVIANSVPQGTCKITFTSGSTGRPKGVCLSVSHLEAVVNSILIATSDCDIERHLCVLPLATLLENVAGVHAPLRRGAQVIVADQKTLGFNGASGFSLSSFLDVLIHCSPDSLILIPQLLDALVMSCDAGWKVPGTLRFVAVGGATVSASLLERAWTHGLPVYEGYGLSECGSVVTLNSPNARRNGTLGRPLPHNRIEIADGEIIVHGRTFLGYAGDPGSWYSGEEPEIYATGDLGYLDSDGYLNFIGRRKNQIVTSYGRNISPEWVQAELVASEVIVQSVVLGDSRPFCVALIAARSPQITDANIAAVIETVNEKLPDYARVKGWIRLAMPMAQGTGSESDLLTSNGRPRRAQIEQHFRSEIDALYKALPQPVVTPSPSFRQLSTSYLEATPMFYETLQSATESDRLQLVNSEIICRCMARDVTLDEYIAFLTQAYHHVKFTVPLLMAVGSRLPDDREWLRESVAEYIKEEIGHQEWILEDIATCGGDKEAVRNSKPAAATELMVSYAWDMVLRRNPIGFFGMVQVLEGTSVSLADYAADQIQEALGLPENAFTYLRSHGCIDQAHIKHLQDLMNRFTDPSDQELLIHSTKMFYRLYKGVFDSLLDEQAENAATH